MFLKFIFSLLILLSATLKAQTLHIEYGFNIFSIEVTEKEIKYQKKTYHDSVIKRKCSANLFNNFSNKVLNLTKSFPPSDESSADFMVKYRFGNKTGKLNPSSSYAKRLLLLAQDFDAFRLATEFRCEGEKD